MAAWVLLSELETGLKSPPSHAYRDSGSVSGRPPIRTTGHFALARILD